MNWLLALFLSGERIALTEPRFPANFGPDRCVRLRVPGAPRTTEVRLNGTLVGELGEEADRTGFLRHGETNHLELQPPASKLQLVISSRVYLARVTARGQSVEVWIANTTENTMQTELTIGSTQYQFTVSPGTVARKEFPWAGETRVSLRATSDGLDSVHEDSEPVER
jgi:hypothetical protein